jgi:hypothetical protein
VTACETARWVRSEKVAGPTTLWVCIVGDSVVAWSHGKRPSPSASWWPVALETWQIGESFLGARIDAVIRRSREAS